MERRGRWGDARMGLRVMMMMMTTMMPTQTPSDTHSPPRTRTNSPALSSCPRTHTHRSPIFNDQSATPLSGPCPYCYLGSFLLTNLFRWG